jgi:hypothetical protein
LPRRTIVTTAFSPKSAVPLKSCITKLNVAGSVVTAFHWQSTKVFCATSVVGPNSEIPAASGAREERLRIS